ncbi:phosphoglycerate kinase [Devosia sp. 66-22]|uniref:phosphoglycerate kinase n=1 Tax=Devosia sp. 66-22 TaxID=1895753 RepID=UPI0009274923|nr:phosphoglycerate kinase [Devosia sp. 66-22]OJX53133.1 MAG: phosphoglycerate kinase [Devosia sp. 66-22]
MAGFRTIEGMDFAGKRVLLRADLNVPVQDGKVTDATRIERVVPTIRQIIKTGGKAVLISHFGRPKGKVEKAYSLEVVVPAIVEATGHPVGFIDTDWMNMQAPGEAIDDAPDGSILVLENTRFHPGEEENDPALVERMASLGDIFVNDAFSAAHRAHASTEGLAHKLPSAAGLAMQAELEALAAGLGAPKKPVIAIVGGAKVSTKIDLLQNLVTKVEALVIGGAMANTFLLAEGIGIGKSLAEKDMGDTVNAILAKAEKANCAIIVPIDGVVAWHFAENAPHQTYGLDAMDKDGMILDVGGQSIDRIKAAIDEAATLVWNGPLGAFETKPFDAGTTEVARHVAARTRAGKLVSVAGGGDTVSALANAGVKDDFTYVSTAGGAFLEWMEGKELPGVKALEA